MKIHYLTIATAVMESVSICTIRTFTSVLILVTVFEIICGSQVRWAVRISPLTGCVVRHIIKTGRNTLISNTFTGPRVLEHVAMHHNANTLPETIQHVIIR